MHALFGHLTDAFLCSAVPLATDSERQRNSNPRKVYPADPADPGLIRAFDASGRSNVGHALETAVHGELERRGADIGYVKTPEGSSDFLARQPASGEELIQVSIDLSDPETLSRERRALELAGRQHPRAERLLLMLDRDALAQSHGAGVEARPAYEWMLAAPVAD